MRMCTKEAFQRMLTLRITAEVVLSGRQAVSVLTPLTLRQSLTARRALKLLHALKKDKDR